MLVLAAQLCARRCAAPVLMASLRETLPATKSAGVRRPSQDKWRGRELGARACVNLSGLRGDNNVNNSIVSNSGSEKDTRGTMKGKMSVARRPYLTLGATNEAKAKVGMNLPRGEQK